MERFLAQAAGHHGTNEQAEAKALERALGVLAKPVAGVPEPVRQAWLIRVQQARATLA